MDTITQITLGAAVGEAVLGKKIGNKAPLWGATLGVVPDLDVLTMPFVTEVQALALHRGITHSILFCIAGGLLAGWLLDHLYRKRKIGWPAWSWMAMLVFATHVFIDLCTSYGTQILQPFSNQLFSLNSIFIIDPFYTLPLLAGIITALFLRRNSSGRRWANYLGIGASSLYLLAGLGIKAHANSVFEQNFETQDINPDQYMTTPTPFNILLWTGYAERGDTLYIGLYSILDEDRTIRFHRVTQHEVLLQPYHEQLPVERLLWFSRGYFVADKTDSGELIVSDLRFGRSDLWLGDQPVPYSWNYRLQFNDDSTRVTGFDQFNSTFEGENTFSRRLEQLITRISGNERQPESSVFLLQ